VAQEDAHHVAAAMPPVPAVLVGSMLPPVMALTCRFRFAIRSSTRREKRVAPASSSPVRIDRPPRRGASTLSSAAAHRNPGRSASPPSRHGCGPVSAPARPAPAGTARPTPRSGAARRRPSGPAARERRRRGDLAHAGCPSGCRAPSRSPSARGSLLRAGRYPAVTRDRAQPIYLVMRWSLVIH